MLTLTPEELARITGAPTAADALRVTGELAPRSAHSVRLAYIKAALGPRATGGYFQPTRANVRAKFINAWARARDI